MAGNLKKTCIILMIMTFCMTSYIQAGELIKGMADSDVYALQTMLADIGYYDYAPDGDFGWYTEACVRQFQQDYGLYIDGVVGDITRGVLQEAAGVYNSPYQMEDPERTDETSTPADTSQDIVTEGSDLYLGMTGSGVQKLQIALKNFGYYPYDLDGDFGFCTQEAVMRYQSEHGLYVDGVAGPQTLSSLYGAIGGQASTENQESDLYERVFTRNLSKGMTGADVTALQSMLSAIGYPVGTIDGDFGSYTEAAVMAFQRDQGTLSVDGVAGPYTCEALDDVLSSREKKPNMLIYDNLLATGTSYTVEPVFADGKEHEVTLTSSSSNIFISGMTITAVASGTAEVRAECEEEIVSFVIAVRDQAYIDTVIGDIDNARDVYTGLEQRLKGLESYPDDTDTMVLFAGDSYLDERLYLTDFYTSRFPDSNVYTSAISGSTAKQWLNQLSKLYIYQPASLVLNLGINDIRHGETADAVVNDLTVLFQSVRQNMPDTTVYWWNIAPYLGAGEEYYKIAAVNTALQDYSKQTDNLVIVDSYDALTNSNGIANKSLYQDILHPNKAGYDQLFQKTFQAGLQVTQSTK